MGECTSATTATSGKSGPEATLDDLDLELAAAFLATTPAGERGSTIQALHGYGLMEPEGEGWRITNAALLLFGREPADRWHPRAGIGAFRVTGTRRVPGRAGNVNRAGRADPPLARAIEEIRPIVRAHIRRSDPLRDIFFRDLPEYPDAVWQEALVNAIAHRDYEVRDRETEVWFFDDRLEVASPGELVEPLTLKALTEGDAAPAARNPLIARVLADAGYMRGRRERTRPDARRHEGELSEGARTRGEGRCPFGHAAQGTDLRDRRARMAVSCAAAGRLGRPAADPARPPRRIQPRRLPVAEHRARERGEDARAGARGTGHPLPRFRHGPTR